MSSTCMQKSTTFTFQRLIRTWKIMTSNILSKIVIQIHMRPHYNLDTNHF